MMKFCASFFASVVRSALSSCNRRWDRYKVLACNFGVAFAWLLLASTAAAQTDDIWKGSTSTSWSANGNWTLASPPGATNVVRFDNNSTANLNTNQDIASLSVSGIVQTSAGANNGVAGPVSITGNPITVGATGLIMVSGNPQGPSPYTQPAQADMTVDVDLTLSADQRWKAGGPGAATTAQPSGNQALIVGASANSHTVSLNGFKPILTVISNANDQIIVNSTLVDGSAPSQVGISKATGSATTFAYDTGNINTTTRIRISGNNTYSGGTDILGGRQLIQINSNSVAGVSGPFGTGPITVHTESLVSGTINNQAPYFSPFGADRTLSNDFLLNNVLTSTGSTPVQSYPTMYNAGTLEDTSARMLTLNGAISIQTNASVLQNSASSNHTSAPGDLVVNGTVLLGGADFNDDGTVDAGDYVAWRKNSAAHGGADGYRIWRETFGTTIPTPTGTPITTGTFTTGQTASGAVAPGKIVYNSNILQTNAAAYSVNIQNGSATQPTIVQLFGQNTYSGGTTINSIDASSPTANANIGLGSSTILGGGGAIISGPLGTGTLSIGSATAGNTSSIEALSSARTLANPISLPFLQSNLVVRGSNDVTLNGAITGFGGVTMNGTGKLTLGGVSTYAAATNVNSGTMLVNGSIAGSGVTVASGATLGGSGGTIASTITNNGTIAPGASVGTLNVTGAVNDQASSSWAIELSGATSDLLAVTGNIDLSAVDNLNVTGSGTGSSWVIATYSGTLTGTFDSVTAGYSVDYGTGANSQITLHTPGSGAGGGLGHAAVPEPGTISLGLFAVGLATVFRRRNCGKQ
jgi:autotransporter-associated beta strand protein